MEHYFVRIKKAVPKTHYFVYKDKEYPFNFYFFTCSSKYFLTNQEEIKSSQKIHLVDEDSDFVLNFSDKIVEDFIRYAQREEICLNIDNVSFLNYLAKKYEVQDLIEDTEEYISMHYSELILQILSTYQNDPTFESSTYEEFLSEHFIEYINEDLLLTLKIPIISRTLKKFLSQNSINTQLFDFLFKYLDKHGREASILFSYVDFDAVKPEYLNLLMNKYSEKFDFYFINSTLHKRLLKTLTDANRQKQEYEDQINSLKNQIQQNKNHLQQMNNQNQKYEKIIDDMKLEINLFKKGIIIDDVSDNPERQIQIQYNEKIKTVFDLRKLVAQDNGFNREREIDLVSLFIPFSTEYGPYFALLNDTEQIIEIISKKPSVHFAYEIINEYRPLNTKMLKRYIKVAKEKGLEMSDDEMKVIYKRTGGNLDNIIATIAYIASKRD